MAKKSKLESKTKEELIEIIEDLQADVQELEEQLGDFDENQELKDEIVTIADAFDDLKQQLDSIISKF